MVDFFRKMGFFAAVLMPFWNIPLILRIIKRKSSADISLGWLFGVWGCVLFMLPSAILSPDFILQSFGLINAIFFTGVVVTVLIYRKK